MLVSSRRRISESQIWVIDFDAPLGTKSASPRLANHVLLAVNDDDGGVGVHVHLGGNDKFIPCGVVVGVDAGNNFAFEILGADSAAHLARGEPPGLGAI